MWRIFQQSVEVPRSSDPLQVVRPVLTVHVLQCDWGLVPEVQWACTHVDFAAQLITVLLPCLRAGAMQRS